MNTASLLDINVSNNSFVNIPNINKQFMTADQLQYHQNCKSISYDKECFDNSNINYTTNGYITSDLNHLQLIQKTANSNFGQKTQHETQKQKNSDLKSGRKINRSLKNYYSSQDTHQSRYGGSMALDENDKENLSNTQNENSLLYETKKNGETYQPSLNLINIQQEKNRLTSNLIGLKIPNKKNSRIEKKDKIYEVSPNKYSSRMGGKEKSQTSFTKNINKNVCSRIDTGMNNYDKKDNGASPIKAYQNKKDQEQRNLSQKSFENFLKRSKHYSENKGCSDSHTSNYSFYPKISKKSLEIANKMGDPFVRLTSSPIHNPHKKEDFKSSDDRQVEACTFVPKINDNSAYLDSKNNHYKKNRSEILYNKAQEQNFIKEKERILQKELDISEEMQQCTFQPVKANNYQPIQTMYVFCFVKKSNGQVTERMEFWSQAVEKRRKQLKAEQLVKQEKVCSFR